MNAAEWFERYPDLGKHPVFTLRVTLSGGQRLTIRAFEGPVGIHGHTTLYCELRQGSMQRKSPPLFPRECFHVGVPAHQTIDGLDARELVLSLFAMKPGDADDEFFADYTPEQLAFVEAFGEELDFERGRRYLDENGNIRCSLRSVRR